MGKGGGRIREGEEKGKEGEKGRRKGEKEKGKERRINNRMPCGKTAGHCEMGEMERILRG